jgi:hypothetical protein
MTSAKTRLILRKTAMNISQVIRETFFTKTDMQVYKPAKLNKPENMLDVISAWKGLELIIEDILDGFNIKRDRCIEFGVEFGYSTVAFLIISNTLSASIRLKVISIPITRRTILKKPRQDWLLSKISSCLNPIIRPGYPTTIQDTISPT